MEQENQVPGLRSLYYLSRLQAIGAYAQTLVGAFHNRADGAQIDIPATLGHVMGVADVVSKTRPFAANCAYLCHFR